MGYLSDFLCLVYPRVCHVCGSSLFRHERVVCSRCLHHLPAARFTNDPSNPAAQVFWGRVPLENVLTAFLYNKGNAIQQLIHKLKYRGMKEIGIFLGEALGREIAAIKENNGISCIVPVPLHPRKQRKRGFNQSEIIAAGIAKVLGVEVNTDALYRRNFSSTQTRKSKYERWQNVESIFGLRKPETVMNRHILLVDDVITTGSTIEACARALLRAEGVKVSVAAVAFTRG